MPLIADNLRNRAYVLDVEQQELTRAMETLLDVVITQSARPLPPIEHNTQRARTMARAIRPPMRNVRTA